MISSNSQPPNARPAATVVPLRDSDDGLECLVTVRRRELSFMGGATVFPGGALTAGDVDSQWARASKLDPADAGHLLDEEDEHFALGLFVCALREAFEEVGLVLGEGPLHELDRRDACEGHAFLRACLSAGVVLGTDRLVPAGRWVGPPGAAVQFDARFFVTAAPDRWEPTPDDAEVSTCRWTKPDRVLQEFAEGGATLAPPTVAMLQRLSEQSTVDDALGTLAVAGIRRDQTVYSARVGAAVRVVVAPNASVMTGPGTNTYIVGTGPYAVIDPAVDDDAYLDAVLAGGPAISHVVVTHRHPDHTGGVRTLVERTGAPVLAYGEEPAGGAHVEPVLDRQIIAVAGVELEALHCPGHAPDHLCFFTADDRSLFAGDVVLGEGTSVIAPPEGNMRAYLRTLERLASLRVRRVYPGHFRVRDDGESLLRDYIAHRKERERAILASLEGGAATLEEVVASAYADTPKELHAIALHSARAHLEMLEEDGRVSVTSRGWMLTA